MLRSIKSGQRKMRVIALKLEAGELVDALDKRQVEKVGSDIKIKVPFAQMPIVMVNGVTASATAVDTVEIASGTEGDILIIGSDTKEKY